MSGLLYGAVEGLLCVSKANPVPLHAWLATVCTAFAPESLSNKLEQLLHAHTAPRYAQLFDGGSSGSSSSNAGSSNWLLAQWLEVVHGFALILLFVWMVVKAVQRGLSQVKYARLNATVPCVQGGTPILGQALNMMARSPWDVMTDWVKEYGHIYQFPLFGTRCVAVADPVLLQRIMHKQFTHYNKDLVFAYKPFLSLLGTGIVTSDGPHWRKQRNRVSRALRVEILEHIPDMAFKAALRLAAKLDQIAGTGQSLEVGEEFRHLTLQVISAALMSLSAEESDGTFAHMYMPIVVEGHRRIWNPLRRFCFFLPFWHRHRRQVRTLNDFLEQKIRARWELRAAEAQAKANAVAAGAGAGRPGDGTGVGEAVAPLAPRREDILDRVMGYITPQEWSYPVVKQLRDEIKTFVLAGHETSAAALNWALYELTQNPGVCAQALSEAEGVYGSNYGLKAGMLPQDWPERGSSSGGGGGGGGGGGAGGRGGGAPWTAKLPFAEACIKETLRKYSLVPTVSRVCVKDHVIEGNDEEQEGQAAAVGDTAAAAAGGGTEGRKGAPIDGSNGSRKLTTSQQQDNGASKAGDLGGMSVGGGGGGGLRKQRPEVHFIPKGTIVMLLMKGVHESAKLWPEPSRFRPERFWKLPRAVAAAGGEGEGRGAGGRGEGGQQEGQQQQVGKVVIPPYHFLPFIDGPRNCIGQHLSLLETKVVLSLLVHRYKFACTNPEERDAGKRHPWMVPVIPRYGTFVTVEHRE